MSRYRFSASLPRKMYWSDEVGGCTSCPNCHAPLESEQHTYMMATRRAGNLDAYMVGNTAGHFCSKCPIVVLDREEFERFSLLATRDADGVEYAVIGIVDLDAVPENKRNLPFDDNTNPVPLVQFTNVGGQNQSGPSGTNRSGNKKRKKKRR